LEDTFVIGGFIPSDKGGVESLVLGKAEGAALRYVACVEVRTPIRASKAAAKTLKGLKVARCPFPEIPERESGNSWSGGMSEQQLNFAVWIKPRHTADVRFLEWTRGGFLRHAEIKEVNLSLRGRKQNGTEIQATTGY
jgi:ATP-dependent DNA ligase